VHAADVVPDQIVTVAGLPVTNIPRTLVDLACTEDPRTAVAAADRAMHGPGLRPAALAALLEAAGPRRGVGRARKVLAFADGRAESVGESILRWVLGQVGLPPPEPQMVARSADGRFLGRVDLAYPQFAVILEFDGNVKYGRYVPPGRTVTDVVVEEKRRESGLAESGFIVIRVIWSELFDPAVLGRRVRDAIIRGRSAISAGGVTGSLTPTEPVRLP
jgi:hypothetical protein